MPSPFPGMDPYLESPDWFPCLHDGLIFGILESLQARLPEPYYAQSTQRVWLEVSHRSVEPDVNVILEDRLPAIAIPLLPGDPEVPLSLQDVFERAYNAGPYRRAVGYGEDPMIPPLRPEQLEWVEGRLNPPA